MEALKVLLRKTLGNCVQGPEVGTKARTTRTSSTKQLVPAVAQQVISRHFHALCADGQRELLNEYDTIGAETEPTETSDAAEHSANARKNRYCNVLPFDYNRVKISGETDYINASLLESAPGEHPSWCYIAAQGPLTSTTADFWKMVYENNVASVVCLTLVENNNRTCAQYFPNAVGETLKFKHHSVCNLATEHISEDIVQRQLQIKHQAQDPRTVSHYHYQRWPDHGVPRGTESIRMLSRLLWHNGDSSPLVVHCSAGIGRTGAFIAIDVIMKRLREMSEGEAAVSEEDVRQAVDVPAVVRALRRMRRGMVQTLDQYEFIYRALIEELEGWSSGGAGCSSSSAASTPLPASATSLQASGPASGKGQGTQAATNGG